MRYKKGSVISLLFLVFIGILGIYFATQFQTMPGQGIIGGPKFYPILLCSLLILFSLIALAETLLKADKVIEIPNLKRAAVVFGIIILWVLLWQYLCGFYISTLIGIAAMLLYLNPEKMGKHKLISMLLTDSIITGFIYLVFTVMLNTNI